MLYVQSTPEKGRGVFTSREFLPKDQVMVCPAIEAEKSQFKDTIFMDYVFHHPTNDNHYVMSLGLCAMANHSEDPNCEWTVETPPESPRMW